MASPGYCTLSCPRPGCTITSIIYATLANNVGSCPLLVQGTPSTTPSSPLYSTGPPNPVSSPVYLPPSPLLPVPPPVVASPAGSTSTSSSAGPTVAATNLPTTTSPVSTCTVDFTADATTACIGQQACVVSSNRGDPAWIPCDAGSVNYLTIVATYNFLGDGGPATNAVLRRPYGVSFRSNVGDLFITDTTAQLIRTVSAFSGLISTIVGIPNACGAPSSELNLAGTTTKLCYPYDVVTDQSGNCYIADRNNHRIRMWTASTGMVATFAGYGFAGFTSDNVAATSAALNFPSGVTLDSGGNVYISDTNNNAIRRVDILTNIITTIVGYYRMATYGGDYGRAYTAYLNKPRGICFDSSNNLYIADAGNHRIRKITNFCVVGSGFGYDWGCTNIITTIAGNGMAQFSGDYGAATSASLSNPVSVVVNAAGAVFISDSGNQRVREVGAVHGSTTPVGSPYYGPISPQVIITTVAGTGIAGYDGDGYKSSQNAMINGPQGLAIDPTTGNVFIADSSNGAVRLLFNPTIIPQPSASPTALPSSRPSNQPSARPTHPTSRPSNQPTFQPTMLPSGTRKRTKTPPLPLLP